VALSRSSHGRLQAWAIRAIAAFLIVYLLGAFGVPTLIPYVAAVIAVVVDGARMIVRREGARPPALRGVPRTDRGETIH
jgi:hypothetical protein